MSYAANPSRIKASTVRENAPRQGKRSRPESNATRTTSRTATRQSFDESRDWRQIFLIGATIAAGAALGAGAALLMTDKTGSERRAGIAFGARRLGHRAEHAWDDLAFELREAARGARNRLRRRRRALPRHAEGADDEV
jgi:hypothetical protein